MLETLREKVKEEQLLQETAKIESDVFDNMQLNEEIDVDILGLSEEYNTDNLIINEEAFENLNEDSNFDSLLSEGGKPEQEGESIYEEDLLSEDYDYDFDLI